MTASDDKILTLEAIDEIADWGEESFAEAGHAHSATEITTASGQSSVEAVLVELATDPKYRGKRVMPYIKVDELEWTSANLSQCKAAVAEYRPCVARFANAAVVEFDGDPSTDAYN